VADLGVVGDLTKLLPKLTAKIKEEKERMAS
jgi:electron transfer flavoprotein alpha subunit